MIKSLFIKDFILVDRAEVEFGPGLTIITGETGAGKSILVNALGQLCGERSSTELVRTGAKKAVVEAHLKLENTPEVQAVLTLLDVDDTLPELIIRKEISAGGSFRIFLNDSPVTLSNLNQLSTLLFDLHGQHQHQRLLHPEYHAGYLDDFGGLESERKDYLTAFKEYHKALRDKERLTAMQAESLRLQDLYRFQFDELEKAGLDADETEALREELRVLSNVEHLHADGAALAELLYAADPNAGHFLVKAEQHLSRMSTMDRQFTEMLENLRSARETIEEIGRYAEHYVANLEFNPERAEFIRERLAHIDFLMKKYQQENINGLISYKDEAERKLDETIHFDARLAGIEERITGLAADLQNQGAALSEKRVARASEFEQAISAALKEIGMPDARFHVRIDPNASGNGAFQRDGIPVTPREDGFDVIQFDVSLNSGEPFRPLHKTASGGEISRIMLSLKTVLAGKDRTPVLIFDEIDSGISGKTAQIVGKKMSGLGKYHQILCVTHLPQIAAFADQHIKVSKNAREDHTSVSVEQLFSAHREQEVAHLLGGETISSQALENARQLLQEADSIKK